MHQELTLVSLLSDKKLEAGTLPAGTRGTIVGVWRDGWAYEVEFTEPYNIVLTLAAAQIVPVEAT